MRIPVMSVIVLLSGLLPAFTSSAWGQPRNGAERLRRLALDSLVGAIPVHYSAGHADRATTLQDWYRRGAAFYEDTLNFEFSATLALLDGADWRSFTPVLPYGVPHIDYTGWPQLIVVLPATNQEGLTADAARQLGISDPRDVERYVDVIGYHEFGHALVTQYLYRNASGGRVVIHWFDEFMATYFGLGYLWLTEVVDTDPFTLSLFDGYTPQHRSLGEFEQRYMQLAATDLVNLGWYQATFAEQARMVFARHGLDFVVRIHDELPWSRYHQWTTEELLALLSEIEPSFVPWADSLRDRARLR